MCDWLRNWAVSALYKWLNENVPALQTRIKGFDAELEIKDFNPMNLCF